MRPADAQVADVIKALSHAQEPADGVPPLAKVTKWRSTYQYTISCGDHARACVIRFWQKCQA